MNIIRILRLLFAAHLLQAGLLAIIFETALLPAGQLTASAQDTYLIQIVGVLLALVCIPLAMKLMHFERIRLAVKENEARYFSWSLIRLGLLAIPLLFNLLMYYLLGFNVSFGYLALMALVPYIFVWPSRSKMEYECQFPYDKDQD